VYHVEGYAHASGERFGVMAGSLLGHEAGLLAPSIAARLANGLKRGPSRAVGDDLFLTLGVTATEGPTVRIRFPPAVSLRTISS
jgi:hypothetical protein